MKIDLLTIYFNDEDFYGIDLISINGKVLLGINYDSFFKKIHLELFFKVIR